MLFCLSHFKVDEKWIKILMTFYETKKNFVIRVYLYLIKLTFFVAGVGGGSGDKGWGGGWCYFSK